VSIRISFVTIFSILITSSLVNGITLSEIYQLFES